ncbi:MAG: STAS domain-containing protein [Acidobacteriota bacterium]
MLRLDWQKISEQEIRVLVKGALLIGPDASRLRELLSILVPAYPDTVVDLAGLNKIDSTGVGLLVESYSLARKHQHRLRLVNAAGRVREVLLLVKLLTVFEEDGKTRGQAA